jgi:hypothetical protein
MGPNLSPLFGLAKTHATAWLRGDKFHLTSWFNISTKHRQVGALFSGGDGGQGDKWAIFMSIHGEDLSVQSDKILTQYDSDIGSRGLFYYGLAVEASYTYMKYWSHRWLQHQVYVSNVYTWFWTFDSA